MYCNNVSFQELLDCFDYDPAMNNTCTHLLISTICDITVVVKNVAQYPAVLSSCYR